MSVPRLERLLEPVLTRCDTCPGWEVACFTDTEKAAKEAAHAHHKHGVPLPTRELSGGSWQEQAMDAIRQVAARGEDFRIYDALAEFGLQSPPDAKSRLGKFTVLVHDLGIAHKVSDAPSTRPGTKASAAGVWNRNPARCQSPRCKMRAGCA